MVRTAPDLKSEAVASASVSCAPRPADHAARGDQRRCDDRNGNQHQSRQFGLQIISAVAPMNMKRLRKAIEAGAEAALICVVSAVRRDTGSPVRAVVE